MTNRREFLGTAGLFAMGAALGLPAHAKEKAPKPWAPYRKSHVIDGLSGVDALLYQETDKEYPAALDAVRKSGMTAVMMTAGPQGRFWYNDAQFEDTKKRMTDWSAAIAKHSDLMAPVLSKADLEARRKDRRVGVIYTFQGAEPLGEDLDRIKIFHDLGLRVMQPTHNRRNLMGDGATEPGNAGLSKLGHELIERLEDAKIVVDFAHGSQRTVHEGILATKKPMLISHSGCRSLVDAPRLIYDEDLKAMADRGGVVGIIFWPYIRKQGQQTSADVIRHIEHAIEVCGEDHVGIGTDLGMSAFKITPEFEKENTEMIKDMIEQGIFEKDRDPNLFLFPPDLNTPNRFEGLAGMLSAKGFSDARIEKVLGGNFARVMGDTWG